MTIWDRCAICGKSIPVGELCYGVKNWRGDPIDGDTICSDCLVPENAPTLTPPNEWVSVEEKLPEVDDSVLVNIIDTFDNRENIVITKYTIGLNLKMEWLGFEHNSFKVTHWMPLPAPPTKDENNT